MLDSDALRAAHVAAGGTLDVTCWKNALSARCHRFGTVQGGRAHHIACFKGSLIVMLHRSGQELRHAYSDARYRGFLTNPAPMRALCIRSADLLAAVQILTGSAVVRDRLQVDPRRARLLARFAPDRFVKAR